MASALETLCGQSFGAKRYHMVGIHTQRAMLTLIIFSVPLSFLLFYTCPILLFLGQDAAISDQAGVFNRWMVPSLFAQALLQCLNRFLQTQNIVLPMMASSLFTASLHIPICWALVFWCGFGSRGAAMANSISIWLNVALLAAYVRVSPKCAKTWTGFSREALHDILGFVKLAVPSATMIWSVFYTNNLFHLH